MHDNTLHIFVLSTRSQCVFAPVPSFSLLMCFIFLFFFRGLVFVCWVADGFYQEGGEWPPSDRGGCRVTVGGDSETCHQITF